MKKIILISIVLISTAAIPKDLKAQSGWELGLRFGDRGSVEATAPLSSAVRIKPVLYFYDMADDAGSDLSAAAYFDWLFNLGDNTNGFKIFPGVGVELFFEHEVFVALAGDFGVEYAFDFPMTIGLDWRPSFFLSKVDDFDDFDEFEPSHFGISLRYRFGKGVK